MTLIKQLPPESSYAWRPADFALLAVGLQALEQETTLGQQQQLRTYGELLLKWNATYNLLGATATPRIIQDHLLDCVAVQPVLARWLPPQQLLVDVGSGAGLPGILLAIIDPHRPFLLVEPIGKKAAFLRQVAATCRLPNVLVREACIEEGELEPPTTPQAEDKLEQSALAARTGGPHFICRAFASLERFVKLSLSHASEQSLFFAMKAVKVGAELKDLDPSIEVLAVEALRAAAKDVHRNLVIMRPRRAPAALDMCQSA